MKILKVVAAVAITTTVSANANWLPNNSTQPQIYAGVKVGQMKADIENSKNLTSYGVYGGYNLDKNVSVELDYQGTNTKKSTYNVEVPVPMLGNPNGPEEAPAPIIRTGQTELSAKNYGVYGQYRYQLEQAPVYVKGKLGVTKTQFKSKDSLYVDDKASKTGLGYGIGMGYQVTPNAGLEVGYNRYAKLKTGDGQKISPSALTLGAHIAF